jgi:hypothetical protein
MKFRVFETVTNRQGDVVEIPQGPATNDLLSIVHSVVSALSVTQDRDPVLDRVFETNRITIEFIPEVRDPWDEPPF